MRKLFLPLLTLCLFVGLSFAQKLPKPTQLPNALTDAQQQSLSAAIKLHDAKQYDGAIEIYDKILAENPDSSEVLYEKAMSLYTRGDKQKAMETAYLGAKYKSDQLALFYTVMATCLDDVGKPDEAIQIYRQAEDMLKSDIGMKHHLSSVYFNLGVAYLRQKKNPEARTELKKSVENNFAYASPHYLLAAIYNGSKYKIPAFLAAARFLSLEYNTPKSKNAAAILSDTLKPPATNPDTGNVTIFLSMDAPKDEGDFGMYDLLLGTLMIAKDKNEKARSENEMFVDAVGTLIGLLSEDKKLRSSFIGKNYVPFMVEMKRMGYVEPFGYMALYISGKADAMTWLKANDAKFGEFMKWAKGYQLPTK